jgi:hypothetical protein
LVLIDEFDDLTCNLFAHAVSETLVEVEGMLDISRGGINWRWRESARKIGTVTRLGGGRPGGGGDVDGAGCGIASIGAIKVDAIAGREEGIEALDESGVEAEEGGDAVDDAGGVNPARASAVVREEGMVARLCLEVLHDLCER